MTDGGHRCGNGQSQIVLFQRLLGQPPEPARDNAKQDPAAQGDPKAFQHTGQAFRRHKRGEGEGQKSGGGGIGPDRAQAEHGTQHRACRRPQQHRAQNHRDVHGGCFDDRQRNKADSRHAHDQQYAAEHGERRHVAGVHLSFLHIQFLLLPFPKVGYSANLRAKSSVSYYNRVCRKWQEKIRSLLPLSFPL